MSSDDWTQAGPEAMRQRLKDYVYALHKAYLGQADLLAPAERAAMPLLAGSLEGKVVVAVAAARELHVIATAQALPVPRGPEVELTDECADLGWSVRFFDPSILPGLGVSAAAPDGSDDPHAVRRVLGVSEVLYHLSVMPGGGLTEHHAHHAGVGLANQHAGAFRDGQALRAAFPHAGALVDEFVVAAQLGLPLAARLLARELVGDRLTSAELAGDPAGVRRGLLRVAKETS